MVHLYIESTLNITWKQENRHTLWILDQHLQINEKDEKKYDKAPSFIPHRKLTFNLNIRIPIYLSNLPIKHFATEQKACIYIILNLLQLRF